MADFSKSYKILVDLEFGSNPKKFLHRNPTEDTVTLGGVYKLHHQDKIDWDFVANIMEACTTKVINIDEANQKQQDQEDLERASIMLYADEETRFQVYSFFKNEFWQTSRLDEVYSQKAANRIFLMATNAGTRKAVKIAQEVSMALADGYLGNITLKCINNMRENEFAEKYDRACKLYYEELAEAKPHLKRYLPGWINRFAKIEEHENRDIMFS